MKIIPLIFFILLFSATTSAQSKNPTNAKELQDKMKQAQQELDKLTPEQKKMMEQMGFSTSVPSMPSGVTDAGISAATAGSEFGVPSKNATLLGAIPNITLTAATIPAYIKTLNDYIDKGIPTDAKTMGQQVYAYCKANKFTTEATGNSAIGFWTVGRPEIAVYIMGRACADNATDADLLSNFAAMLSMGGAPHRAIPLLEYLNKQYSGNSTIINNLGQAWFYLGETDKANAQLEKVVKAFAYHPQANYTLCLIQQSKGNTTKAIESMKNSLHYSYSLNKVNMLRKLGYKVKGSDMRIPYRPDPNPLGLRNFTRPEAPTDYASEIKLKADWDAFQKQILEKNIALNQEMQPYIMANTQLAQKNAQAVQANEQQIRKGDLSSLTGKSSLADNMYSQMAEIRLSEMNKDGGAEYRMKTAKNAIDALLKDYNARKEAKKKELIKQYSVIAGEESELGKKGENTGYDICNVEQKFSEWVYANYNKPLEEAYRNYLHQVYLKITEELYWKQFKYNDETFGSIKITAKKEWLAALSSTRYIETYNASTNCNPPSSTPSRYKLANFDDLHCNYKSVLDFGVYKQIFECNNARIEFDAGRFKGNLNFISDDKGNSNFSKGTVEATVIDKSISMDKGPLEIGANVKAGMGVEFTNKGIEDVYVTGEASLSAKTNIIKTFDQHISDASGGDKSQPGMSDAQLSDKGVEVGVSGRMSLISGNMTGAISGFGK
ncbi:MAG: hypothetical protein DI535_07690 [Citrobacter freundii]|nr:MAG: hypothetical protein DI535_07690 [Citrobacter freundii]